MQLESLVHRVDDGNCSNEVEADKDTHWFTSRYIFGGAGCRFSGEMCLCAHGYLVKRRKLDTSLTPAAHRMPRAAALTTQTGSGKTFTIYGNPADPGLTPRGISELFRIIDRDSGKYTFSVSCYMLELYQVSYGGTQAHAVAANFQLDLLQVFD